MQGTKVAGAGEGRYENIDVLRGVAALLVLWLHASEVYVQMPAVQAFGTWVHDVAAFFEFGRAGVIAFFAISGFVVASTIKPPKFEGTVQFVIKRFFRLYPAYWLALALSYILIWGPLQWEVKARAALANITMVPTFFGVPGAMGHFWTLEIEFLFYCLVVVLFLSGKLASTRLLVTLTCVLSIQYMGHLTHGLRWAEGQGHWSQVPQCLAIMLWGSLLRRGYNPAASALEKMKAWNTLPVIIATVFVFGRALGLGALFKQVDLHTWLSGLGTLWGLLLFVAFALSGRGWPRWIVWLGTISYSIYLLHPLVVHPLHYALQSHPQFAAVPAWALVALVALLTVAVSSLSYVVVEAPCNRIAARIAGRFRGRVAAVRVGAPAVQDAAPGPVRTGTRGSGE